MGIAKYQLDHNSSEDDWSNVVTKLDAEVYELKAKLDSILRYIEMQKKTQSLVPLDSEFKEGIVVGLDLVKVFIEVGVKGGKDESS